MRLLTVLLFMIVNACAGPQQDIAVPDAGNGLWRGVDFSCQTDADCTIENLGNCCGYFPACVNRDGPTFPARVSAECSAQEVGSVCGFPELSGCTCVEGRCEGVTSGGSHGRLD